MYPQSSTPPPFLRTALDKYSRLLYVCISAGMPYDCDLFAILLQYPSISAHSLLDELIPSHSLTRTRCRPLDEDWAFSLFSLQRGHIFGVYDWLSRDRSGPKRKTRATLPQEPGVSFPPVCARTLHSSQGKIGHIDSHAQRS
jgi:hypothetical protein